MLRTRMIVAVVSALGLVSVGCSSSSSSAAAGGIAATEQDFSISVSPSSATAGDITFTITNNGPSTLEFVIIKSDADPASLKVGDDETVPEDSLDVVDEQEEIAPGTAPTLTTNLEAGSYIFICNLPTHYEQGMHTGFTVT
jgi:iron uptake system component EfeO